jgi:F-type H+-transporting ATPase subunit b
MPQFEPSTFSPQLFWLAVSFAVLFAIMWRSALPRLSSILQARQERIDSDLERAASIKQEADLVLAEYEKALAQARDQAAAAIRQSSDAMSAESAQRHEAFGQELAAQTRAAEDRIGAARDAALANIKTVAAETASAATAKLIGVELPNDRVQEAVEAVIGRRE